MSDQIIDTNLLRQAAGQTAAPVAVVMAALANLQNNPAAMYEDHVVDALRVVRQKNEAEYARLITQAKGCKTQLDRLTKTETDGARDTSHDLIIQIAQNHCDFFHTSDEQGFVTIMIDGHREVYLLQSSGFRGWLRSVAYKELKLGISDQIMSTVLATLYAIARYEGNEAEVHMRCAVIGGSYYIDLCNDKWQVVRVSDSGYTCDDISPVFFVRSKNMLPLPTPLANGCGELSRLWKHINIPESSHPLVIAWLLDCFRPETPYPVLEITGGMGSAKSSTQRRLRDLVDPNEAPLRASPKTAEDIHIAAANSYLVSYENLSSLSAVQQDAFCTVSTGGGYSTRQMYTNGEEFVIKSKAPIILNGINPVASRGDLIERAVSIELPAITAAVRRDEQSLDAAWKADYPAIFTGLLDVFSKALASLPAVAIPDGLQKRMLDFQKLGEAAAVASGSLAGTFSDLLDTTQSEGLLRILENYGIANALQVLLGSVKKSEWVGTQLELLCKLSDIERFDQTNWPKNATHLAHQLRRIAPALGKVGIGVEHLGHTRKGAEVRISKRTD